MSSAKITEQGRSVTCNGGSMGAAVIKNRRLVVEGTTKARRRRCFLVALIESIMDDVANWYCSRK